MRRDHRRIATVAAGPTACLLALLVASATRGTAATPPPAAAPPAAGGTPGAGAAPRVVDVAGTVDASTLRGLVLAGYQGWFRCPGDAAGDRWVHWSRDPRRLTPRSLTFEMWPDVSDLSPSERFAAPGFTHADGSPAYLFSSDNRDTVRRHFAWMRQYGLDGVWLQHFAVDLPGMPAGDRYPSRLRVLNHVREAARETGRAWALAYDLSGAPGDKIYDAVTADWRRLVDQRLVGDDRYVREGGVPVVELWGFYQNTANHQVTPELGGRLLDFFHAVGPYRAFVVGGGDWDWRRNPDPAWQKLVRGFDGYSPWNVGNLTVGPDGTRRATTSYWAEDRKAFEGAGEGKLWLPVVYPGFSWDNLQGKPPGSTLVPRRQGRFFWEQFHALARMNQRSACIAMFDEVDEATAIFKVTDRPPTQGHFVGMEGMPSDAYLRLAGEGTRMLRGERPVSAEVPSVAPASR